MAKMKKAGYNQGDMKPKVEFIERPKACYSQEGFSKTNDYLMRKDYEEGHEAKQLRNQAYKGRYS